MSSTFTTKNTNPPASSAFGHELTAEGLRAELLKSKRAEWSCPRPPCKQGEAGGSQWRAWDVQR